MTKETVTSLLVSIALLMCCSAVIANSSSDQEPPRISMSEEFAGIVSTYISQNLSAAVQGKGMTQQTKVGFGDKLFHKFLIALLIPCRSQLVAIMNFELKHINSM